MEIYSLILDKMSFARDTQAAVVQSVEDEESFGGFADT